MLKKNCRMDAAREIRNERSLVYVSVTRAKEEFHLHYNAKNGLSTLFTSVNAYKQLDSEFEASRIIYDDVTSFTEFFRR